MTDRAGMLWDPCCSVLLGNDDSKFPTLALLNELVRGAGDGVNNRNKPWIKAFRGN